jgi:hypothetical protein
MATLCTQDLERRKWQQKQPQQKNNQQNTTQKTKIPKTNGGTQVLGKGKQLLPLTGHPP